LCIRSKKLARGEIIGDIGKNQKTAFDSFISNYFNAKAAKRLRGYLIRLTREYTDGGMDSRAELN
jgi:hypothetical protein